MLETRLFHQYLTSTYHTLSQDGLSAYHLSMSIPRMASSFPYLLDSLLALSALHLASVEDENRASWLDTALNYQGQACSGLGKVISDLSPPDYEPAFVASIFILILAMGLKAISIHSQPPDPVSVVLEVRNLISGPAMISSRIHEAGGGSQLEGWLCAPETQESLEAGEHSHGSAPEEDNKKLFRLHGNIVASLNQLLSTIDTKEDSKKDTYRGTWQLLYQAIEPWPKIGAQGGVIAWPLFLSDEFCSLLQNGEWMARILFLHYGLAMRLMCNRWYVRDWGRRLVMATLEPLVEIPQEWNDTIAWIGKAAQGDD
ncbi:hypothetical protein N7499_009450 [Penicillium canescens]|nr:hypothetical protein N7499_009450 [Penicillium canescens]KAJ6170114.1 hypothetical protein N7485_007460 [Penicillium canescens]